MAQLKEMEAHLQQAKASALRQVGLDLDRLQTEQETEKARSLVARIDAIEKRLTEGEQAAETLAAENVFRKEGDFWRLVYEGRETRMKNSKGLHHIAFLLAHPNRAFTPFEVEGNPVPMPLEALGEMTDPGAQGAVSRELEEICMRLEDNQLDGEQRVELREKKERLEAYQRSTQGLRGRARSFNTAAELARKRVSKAINASLERLRKEHVALRQHLNAIHQGSTFRYTPSSPTPWQL